MTQDAYRGSLLGLAVGDAMGAPVEMNLPGSFARVEGFRGGGYHDLAPGEWTDDTALALCSATSLVQKRGFDAHDHLERFLRWYRHGYMSTRREALGIGLVTAGALMRFETTGEDYCGPTGEKTAANGSLMHIAPVPLAYAATPERGIAMAEGCSRLTHGARQAVDACRYLSALIMGVVKGYSKQELLAEVFDAVAPGIWQREPLAPRVADIAKGDFKQGPPRITAENYSEAVTVLGAALWGFYATETFDDGLLKVVNLGWDADTAGAVYGQLAGAYYGARAIPAAWRSGVLKHELLESLADELLALAGSMPKT